VILCGGDTFWIEKAWLASVQPPRQELAGPLPNTIRNQEKEMIEAALAESKGKVAGPEGAAAKLGIPPSTLDTKIKQLGSRNTGLSPSCSKSSFSIPGNPGLPGIPLLQFVL